MLSETISWRSTGAEIVACFQSGHHLPLFLPVEETVVVLHGNEWSQFIGDSIVCKLFVRSAGDQKLIGE